MGVRILELHNSMLYGGLYTIPVKLLSGALLEISEFNDKWLLKQREVNIVNKEDYLEFNFFWGKEVHTVPVWILQPIQYIAGESCYYLAIQDYSEYFYKLITDWLFFHPQLLVEPYYIRNKDFKLLLEKMRQDIEYFELGLSMSDAHGKRRKEEQVDIRRHKTIEQMFAVLTIQRRYLQNTVIYPFDLKIDRTCGMLLNKPMTYEQWKNLNSLVLSYSKDNNSAIDNALIQQDKQQLIVIECERDLAKEYIVNYFAKELSALGHLVDIIKGLNLTTVRVIDRHSISKIEIRIPTGVDYYDNAPDSDILEDVRDPKLTTLESGNDVLCVYVYISASSKRRFIGEVLWHLNTRISIGGAYAKAS